MIKAAIRFILIGIIALCSWNIAIAQSAEKDELDVCEHSMATNVRLW